MGFYNLTNTFNSLSGDQPAQKLDDNFSQLAVMPLYATLVSGTSDAITLTVPMTFGSYQAGMVFNFIAASTNATATPTINVNAIGAKTVVKQNLPLAAADIVANGVYSVYYDGTNFHLFNPSNTNQHQVTNVVINGAMNIDQRYDGSGVGPITVSGTYLLDRFSWNFSGIGRITSSQSSSYPSAFTFSLRKSLLVTVSTADGTISGTDRYQINYAIEGYDTQPLINNTFTVSFYAQSSVAGTYCFCVTNAAGNNYVAEYSLPLANTWYYISITIPNGLLNSGFGTNITTSFNAYLVWTLASATVGPNNAWNTTANAYATANQVNWMSTAGNTFRITGVQLFQGQSTPEIEPRPFGEELALCQRYYFKQTINTGNNWGTGFAPTTSTFYGFVSFPVAMRQPPTALEQTGTATDYSVGYNNTTAACTSVPVFLTATETSASVTFTTSAVLTQGDGGRLRANAASVYLAWDADA